MTWVQRKPDNRITLLITHKLIWVDWSTIQLTREISQSLSQRIYKISLALVETKVCSCWKATIEIWVSICETNHHSSRPMENEICLLSSIIRMAIVLVIVKHPMHLWMRTKHSFLKISRKIYQKTSPQKLKKYLHSWSKRKKKMWDSRRN